MKSKRLARAALLFACAAALCVLCNVFAFAVDTNDMRHHVWQGCLMLGEQGAVPQMVGGFRSAQMDNYTGVLMLKTAGYVGEESLLAKAFGGFRVDMPAAPGQNEWDAFCSYEFGESAPGGLSYSRYWHGYTLPLRLALCVLDVANLQMLLYFAQLVLFALVLRAMARRALGRLIPGFFLSFFLLMPFSSAVCLQYVPVTLLTLVSCLCVLHMDDRIERAVGMPACFALIGMLTNYFDLLTFPMAALGFPLILLLALRLQAGEGFSKLFWTTALCGIGWGLGFALMWAFKWALNVLVFGPGALHSVFAQVSLRTGDNGGDLSRVAVLAKNFAVILSKKSYLLLIGAAVLATLAPAAKALRQKALGLDLRACVLLLPGLASCAWILLMANHSSDHTYFTYRTIVVAVFAGFAWLSCGVKEDDRGAAPKTPLKGQNP